MIDVLTARECGNGCTWRVPDSVFAFPLGVQPAEGAQEPRSYVALNCPLCGRGHSFYDAGNLAHVAVAKRGLD